MAYARWMRRSVLDRGIESGRASSSLASLRNVTLLLLLLLTLLLLLQTAA
jgi:hypothetical protein